MPNIALFEGNQLVVVGFVLRDLPGPLVSVTDIDGNRIRSLETAALFLGLADDGLVPALVVVPVESLAPEVDAAVELDFRQQVGTGLGAVVGRVEVLVQLVEE